ncbi:hypothetical protein PG994_004286 [Apiospora phragmitis]|uniref:FluG domain-containing protein n=1 Tax=Apiospora phragmitis TaxID=2905665 RepID=A0ABR1VRC2_9PEZI
MLYRRNNKGKVINPNDCEEIVKYINGSLKLEFNLDIMPKAKPVLGVDDLLLGLTQHWARDRSVFPTEDDRLDFATIMLIQAYTACRPAELVDGAKSRGRKDPVIDESERQRDDEAGPDIMEDDSDNGMSDHSNDESVFDEDGHDSDGYESDATGDEDRHATSVKDGYIPDVEMEGTAHSIGLEVDEFGDQVRQHKALCYEDVTLWIVKDPRNRGRDVLAMEVCFRFHKGADNKPKPTIFLLREHPLPILCPISHILARAIRDDAIQVDGYDKAKPFFSTQLKKDAVKVHWKAEWLKRPLFRKSVRTESGGWKKAMEEAMRYAVYAFYLVRLGRDLGSEDRWTSYCFRRGHVNAILGVAPDPVVDQVMRHDPLTGCIGNAYLNGRVGFNVQDAYLERDPSADGLTRAFTHMSIRCNPEQYGLLKHAPQEELVKYRQLQRDLKNGEKRYRDEMTKVYQDVCRRRIHDEELERQLNGLAGEEVAEPAVQHQLAVRTELQGVLCDFNMNLDPRSITKRKIQAIDLFVALAALREVRKPHTSSLKEQRSSRLPGTAPCSVPLKIDPTQCIVCFGDMALPYNSRIYKFSRVSHMMDHVENIHLRRMPVAGNYRCFHPNCEPLGDFLETLGEFKSHVLKVHGCKLRA